MTSIQTGFHGKLPDHGDFLRQGSPEVQELLGRWFGAIALDASRHERGASYGSSGASFVFFPTKDRWWGSVVLPSHDRVGRSYPFAAFGGIERTDLRGELALAVFSLMPFLQQVVSNQDSWDGNGQGLSNLPTWANSLNLTAMERQLATWLTGTRADEVWKDLLGNQTQNRHGVAERLLDLSRVSSMQVSPVTNPRHLALWLMLFGSLHPTGWPSLIVLQGGSYPGMSLVFPSATGDAYTAALYPRLSTTSLPSLTDHLPTTGSGHLPQLDDRDLGASDLIHLLLTERRARLRRTT